jgi:hypothetical protein
MEYLSLENEFVNIHKYSGDENCVDQINISELKT